MSENRCGECRMCCKTKGVDDPALRKLPHTWCKHAGPHGCGIYKNRPKPCVEYECLWLQSQEGFPPLPVSLRPDKCQVVMDLTPDNETLLLWVSATRPDAFRKNPVLQRLAQYMGQIHSVIECVGKTRRVISLTPAGRAKMLAAGHDPDKTPKWKEHER